MGIGATLRAGCAGGVDRPEAARRDARTARAGASAPALFFRASALVALEA